MTFQKELDKCMKAHANSIAIEYEKQSITYSQLSYLSSKITTHLRQASIAHGTIIGVALYDRIHLIASMIGVINAGCVFTLMDYTLPLKRLDAIKKDLNLEYIISAPEIICDNESLSVSNIFFIENIFNTEPVASSLNINSDPEDSIYIYYTSGSTGNPKGIIGKNKSLVQFINWEINTFKIDSSFRVSQLISPYFDAFLRDVFVPLFSGGTICIPPSDTNLYAGNNLSTWIDVEKINLIHCVPSLFRIINSHELTVSSFSNLKYILLSGEKINPSELATWYSILSDRVTLVNLYGATETTMIRSYYMIKPQDIKLNRIPIGIPIADTELVILNKDHKPCETLVNGDLYIVSDYISKGYLNNPQLNAERFIRIKTKDGVEKIGFKTGDKARKLLDGNIDLLGREDRQVKLRGIRVELEEIENVLVRSRLVKNAAIIKHIEENGVESLVGFIILTEKNGAMEENLVKHMEKYVPSYMVPSKYVEVEGFPLLENGKINYKELKVPAVSEKIILPVNPTEERMLLIWKDILGDKAISTEESFLKAGGNSLSIMKLVGRIQQDFSVRVPLSDLFKNLTITKQAELIKKAKKDTLYIIPTSPDKLYYKTSASQKGVYFNYEFNKDRRSYNLPMAWRIKGEFDRNRIYQALLLLIDRHESLRTRFKVIEDELVQLIDQKVDFNLEDLGADADESSLFGDFIRPFNLEVSPLFRAAIAHTSKGDKLLLVDLHHIICDGISQNILYSDFLSYYFNESIAPLNVQYRDYAEWEEQFRLTESYIEHRSFWLQSFDGKIPDLNLPVKNSNVEDLSDYGGNITFQVSTGKLKPLIEDLVNENVTSFSFILSLYYVFLSQLSGQEDIVIGVASSGRTQIELEGVVGMFVKMLPVRYQLDISISYRDLVISLHKYLVEAMSKQHYELADIVKELNNSRVRTVKSLFKAAFVYANFNNKDAHEQAEATFSAYQFENKNSKYPITLYAEEDKQSINFRLEYSKTYFTEEDAYLLISQFETIVSTVTENFSSPVTALSPNSNYEREDISFNF